VVAEGKMWWPYAGGLKPNRGGGKSKTVVGKKGEDEVAIDATQEQTKPAEIKKIL
jgi:hypothetical protein